MVHTADVVYAAILAQLFSGNDLLVHKTECARKEWSPHCCVALPAERLCELYADCLLQQEMAAAPDLAAVAELHRYWCPCASFMLYTYAYR